MAQKNLPGTVEHVSALGGAPALKLPRPRFQWTDKLGAHTQEAESGATLGSAEGVGLRVADATVSRLHARLEIQPDGVWLTDLASRNGTFVSEVRVGSAQLVDGARIRLGAVELRVQLSPPSPVEQWPHEHFGPLFGQSAVMRTLFARISRAALAESAVLIQGETGSGKELVARALHQASARAAGPFVTVDCASLPEALIESELFGHVQGAFTGAARDRAGALAEADGGTLFLDEIGELPLALQPKLLRALESKTFRRLGDNQVHRADVRFAGATHRDLAARVSTGQFREDLYFRLAVLTLEVPPLRRRLEDIPLLVAHLLTPEKARTLSPAFLRELTTQSWSGNVRELRNTLERAVALGEPGDAGDTAGTPTLRQARELWLEQGELGYLSGLIDKFNHDIPKVAQAAGVDRTYVYRLMRKYGLR